MKKMVPFLLAITFFLGLAADVFAADNMGLGRKAKAQMDAIHRDRMSNVILESDSEKITSRERKDNLGLRVKISPVRCIHKAVIDEQFVYVYDQNGEVSIMSVSAREVNIRVPCPKE